MMTTDAQAPPVARKSVIIRLVGATLVSFLILAVTIPNLESMTLSAHRVGSAWRDALSIGTIVAPLGLIVFGLARSHVAEYVGWALLLILLVFRFIS